jgi:hypothetical protein
VGLGGALRGVGALGGGSLGDVDEVEEEVDEEEEEEGEETARIASSNEPTAVVCSHPDLQYHT